MVSKTDICNRALVEAKYDIAIESMTEKSVAAERCNRLYDSCRKSLLSQYPWVFATKRIKLARISEEVEGYKYAYVYPRDCLTMRAVYLNEQDFKFKHLRISPVNNTRVFNINGTKVLGCDYEDPFLEYTFDEQTEENFSELFTRCLEFEIALPLAKLSGADGSDLQLIAAQREQMKAMAEAQSVAEDDNHLRVYDDDYILVREGCPVTRI